MKALITSAVLVAAITISSASVACDSEDAEQRWQQAEESGIVLGAGMVNDLPSFAVHYATWQQLDLNTRTGMVKTFECLIAGPGNVLREAQVLNKGGRVLAVWDGVSQNLEIR